LEIELDGKIHEQNKLYDKDREKYLDGLDIKIIRFQNDDILINIKRVLNDLQNEIKKLMEK
jgi:very-short-patch-repair endonuclease